MLGFSQWVSVSNYKTKCGGKIDGVYDPKNLLDALLPDIDADTFPMLSSLDPYGDTTFNYLQMRRFLQEWTEVSTKAQSPEERDLFSKIETSPNVVETRCMST